jgi:pimeloyl-ACP methyl ester carboxylesterase
MDGTGRLFAGFIAALGRGFDPRVVSYPQDAGLTYAELEELARSANVDSDAFVLVAESFSTPIAIRWAASAPKNLKGLVLCAGFVRSPLSGVRRVVARTLGPTLFRWNPPDFVVRDFLVGRGADSSLVAAVRNALSDVKPEVLQARLQLVLNCDERMNLQQLKLPIVLIRPTRDRLVPAWTYEEIRATNPMVETKKIDSPHLVLQTSPRECVKIVSGFVEVCCGRI